VDIRVVARRVAKRFIWSCSHYAMLGVLGVKFPGGSFMVL
jgi:hypothetical protein